MVIKSACGAIFGGYASSSWKDPDSDIPPKDNGSFVYTLINHKNVPPTKFMASYEYDKDDNYDIACIPECGPIFGVAKDSDGNSINVKNPAEKFKSFTYVQKGYFKDTKNCGLTYFSKGEYFQPAEIEVYALLK